VQASARRVNNDFAMQQYGLRLALPWQQMALFFTSVVPELQYASTFYARMLEKIRIFPAYRLPDDKTEPIEDGLPVEVLDRIQDPGGGRKQLQYRYGKCMMVTGECYLFGRNLGPDAKGPEVWSIVWREKLRFDGDGRVTHMLAPQVPMDTLNFNDSNYRALPAGTAEAYRMWTPALRFSGWASSPMEGIAQVAEELLKLTAAVEATATSRLVKSKLLFLPSEMESPPLDSDGDEDPAQSPWLQDLIGHMTTAIENPSAPESLGPFITYMDGELIGLIRDIDLHNPDIDYLEKDLRDECIRRINRGLDLPPEVVEGMSDSNHWAAWAITEDMWRSHGEPKAQQFCSDLAEAYLRPALREAGFERWDEVVVDFDASGVVVNPDRSDDANEAYDRGELSGVGLRVMKNIPEEFAPSEEEHLEYLAIKKVVIGPDGKPVPFTERAVAQAQGEDVNPGDIPGPPAGEPGDVSEGTNLPASAFQAAAQMALQRCREVAGSRLRNSKKACPDCIAGVADVESALVASALGADGLAQMQAHPSQLVAGGASSLRGLLIEWGNTPEAADGVCRLIEQHAARTLLQERPSIATLASLEIAT